MFAKHVGSISAITAFSIATIANGATLSPTTADALVAKDGGGNLSIVDLNHWGARIGEYYHPGAIGYVIPFQLPALNSGDGFATAQLKLQLQEIGGAPGDVDLYGIGVRSTDTVLTSDFYLGTNDAGATKLQTAFLNSDSEVRTSAVTGPFVTTDAGGSTQLAAYLNAAYADGANAGKFVFLRLNPQDVSPGNNYYNVITQDAGGIEERPYIEYTAGPVPEPTTAILSAAMAGGLMLRRRSNHA